MKSDGVCGLAPKTNVNYDTNLVYMLYSNAGIKKPIFTTYYGSSSPYISFGKLSGNYEPDYKWADMPEGSDRWNMNKLSSNIGISSVGFILDAGSSFTHGPQADIIAFTNWLKPQGSNSDCLYLNFVIQCACDLTVGDTAALDSKFPYWAIEMGTENRAADFKIKGSDYMAYSDTDKKCYSMVRGLAELDTKDYWLLGTNFYRAFKIIHDMNSGRIGYKAITSSEVKQKGQPVGTKAAATTNTDNALQQISLGLVFLASSISVSLFY